MTDAPLTYRTYGDPNLPALTLLHGGPGAPGYLAPVGRELAAQYRCYEPFQRRSGGGHKMTVAQHIADLEVFLEATNQDKAVLVGHSWGAMLALAFAADHPTSVKAVVAICPGTFTTASRKRMHTNLGKVITDETRQKIAAIQATALSDDEKLKRTGDEILSPYSYNLIDHKKETERCDAKGHKETWEDMLRCQAKGLYPESFSNIPCPVLMIHGADDPHPGDMIAESLRPTLPQMDYISLKKCGHYPWLERYARNDFFAALSDWLSKQFT